MTTLDELVQRLLTRSYKGMSLGRERMDAALEALGHPERDVSYVHVGGTNGKGSVCAMLEGMLRHAGYSVGFYSSPHLCRIAERIRVGGEPIDDATLVGALADVFDAGPDDLTFFETLTATAFLVFARSNVDVGILEVGLGGRYDATNVVDSPLATAVVSIGLDHENLLGSDLAGIAREKAGIFKSGCPAVLGTIDDVRARAALIEVAEAVGAPVILANDSAINVDVPLLGRHQRTNAAVAIALLEQLAGRVEPQLAHWRAGVAGLGQTSWPGRLEWLNADQLQVTVPAGARVLLDAAHNPAGAEALAAYLAEDVEPGYSLLYGAIADKRWEPCLDLVARKAGSIYYACPQGRPAVMPETLAARHPGQVGFGGSGVRAVQAALAELPPDGTLVVTGSIYLVGEVRAHLLGMTPDPVIAL